MKKSFTYNYVDLLPTEQIGIHSHEEWELSYIIKGHGTRSLGTQSEPFREGEVVLVPPAIQHGWLFEGKARIANITIRFDDDLLTAIAESFAELAPIRQQIDAMRQHAVMFGKDKALTMARIMRTMRRESEALQMSSLLRLLAMMTASDSSDKVIGGCNKSDPLRIRRERIAAYVACNMQHTITLTDIAQCIGMNRSAFCRFFKQSYGTSFIDYLIRLRINNACQLLSTSSLPISEICYKVGFNDVPHFNRLFKQIVGSSPSEYRKEG